ncbi:tetratricopeptide repeat protein [Schlesneria paludicola]|uniref:tetratricopeptide repeat protein n=1 Tax=Schlesneria paludicola TaxID=360056 RepID=UPI00029AA7F9|nr:tetratricopeptide repeat protein [Schlesneria paludicola]
MQNVQSDNRQSRRYNARKLGYRAAIVVGKDLHEFPVIDFSANGIQIEIPPSVVLPPTGTLHFRDHDYRYTIKRESLEEGARRLGMELRAVLLDNSSRAIHYQPEHFTGKGYLLRKKWSVLFWSTALTGLCITLAVVYGPATGLNTGSNGTLWEQLVRNIQSPSTASGWNLLANRSSSQDSTNLNASTSSGSKNRSGNVTETLNQARTFFSQSNYIAVVESCTQAISINDRNADVWHLRGNAYKGLARYDEAINDFTRAISLNPKAQVIQADLAETFCDAGRFNEGIKQSERSFKQAAGDLRLRFKQLASRAYQGRSNNRLQDGDEEGAQSDLAQAERWMH